MNRCAAAALVCMAAIPAFAGAVPRVRAAPGGEVDIVLPETILRNAEVRKHLTSGLTTSFVVSSNDRDLAGRAVRGALRIDVRYDLWDEKFIVETITADGRNNLSFASYERLVEWWKATSSRLSRYAAGMAPQSLKIEVEVLPFSTAEESSAQKWLSKSLDPSASASGSARHNDPSSSAKAIVDAIIATSVQRRPLLSWRWTVSVEEGAPR